jgi:hypothetical protein
MMLMRGTHGGVLSAKTATAMYAEFGSCISAPALTVTCQQCGHSYQMPRRVLKLGKTEAGLIFTIFDIAGKPACPECKSADKQAYGA